MICFKKGAAMNKNFGLKISLLFNIILCILLAVVFYSGYDPSDPSSNNIRTTYKIQYTERTSEFDSVPTTHAAIVFLGDSLTQNGLWNELFPDASLVNRGIRGDKTGGVLKRLDEVTRLNPDKIFLMIGINDLHSGKTGDQILENYTKIISTLQEKLPETRIYLQSILPVQEEKLPIKNQDIDELNREIEKLADGKALFYIDINSKLKSEKDGLAPEYTADGEHLKGNAYSIWADEVRSYIYQ